jgi:hypothetical protein
LSHPWTTGYGIGWVLDVVVWIDEVVFIKSKGTRMPQIARMRADLEVMIQNFNIYQPQSRL